jgi:hypothetical protein
MLSARLTDKVGQEAKHRRERSSYKTEENLSQKVTKNEPVKCHFFIF